MNIFQIIKERVDTADAAEHYGIKVLKNGMACCPFHDDHNPSMKIGHRFHCFACQEDGDVIDFTAKLFHISYLDAAKKLSGDFNIILNDNQTNYKPKKRSNYNIDKNKVLENKFAWAKIVYSKYFALLNKNYNNFQPKSADEKIRLEFLEACIEKDYIEYVFSSLMESRSTSEIENNLKNCNVGLIECKLVKLGKLPEFYSCRHINSLTRNK